MKLPYGALRGPMLYVWWRGDVALYVGMSMQGFLRLGRWHSRLRAALPTDHIEVRFLPRRLTRPQVQERERALIARLKPVLNGPQPPLRPGMARSPYAVMPREL